MTALLGKANRYSYWSESNCFTLFAWRRETYVRQVSIEKIVDNRNSKVATVWRALRTAKNEFRHAWELFCQLMKISWEHMNKCHFIFKKVNDSGPQEALLLVWKVDCSCEKHYLGMSEYQKNFGIWIFVWTFNNC